MRSFLAVLAVSAGMAITGCSFTAAAPTTTPMPLTPRDAAATPTSTISPAIGGEGDWAYLFRDLESMYQAVDLVVVGEVVQVQPGRTVHHPPSDPELARIMPRGPQTETNFTDVSVRVVDDLGLTAAPDEVLFEMPGGEVSPYFSDHPPFGVGESHLLFLKEKGDDPGAYIVISPQGRYRIDEGRLVSTTDSYEINRELDGAALADVRSRLAAMR